MVHQHSAQDKAPGRDEPSGHLLVETVEDALELGIAVLYGLRAQLMGDATDLDTLVGVGIFPALGADQQPSLQLAELAQFGVIVLDTTRMKRMSGGNPSNRVGVGSLSAVLVGASSAARGIQTEATVVTRWNLQP